MGCHLRSRGSMVNVLSFLLAVGLLVVGVPARAQFSKAAASGTPAPTAMARTTATTTTTTTTRSSPGSVACLDRRRLERLRKGSVYIVQFNQKAERFIYPDSDPMDGDEVVLRICGAGPWNRYRLVFGSKTVGEDALTSTTVGYAPSDVNATLRSATTLLASDQTCQDTTLSPTDKPADNLTQQCSRLRGQVSALVEVAKKVIEARDRLANRLAECGATDGNKYGDCAPTQSAEYFRNLINGETTPEIGQTVNAELAKCGIGEQVVWLDDTWHVIDRTREGTLPSLASAAGQRALPAPIVGYLNVRAELITALQRAMDGYSKLSALALRLQEELSRRKLTFRLGRFAGNRLVVGTLEEHTGRLGYTQDRKHLTYTTERVPHQISLIVRPTSHVELGIGVAFSTVTSPKYDTRLAAGDPPTEVIERTSDGRELSPVIFASFLWCAQALDRPWISRSCRDGGRGWKWWLPRLVVGLPLSADLGRGSAYAGLSLPYIPYVSLIAGAHAQRVSELGKGLQEGNAAPSSGNVPTREELDVGFFTAVSVTEEVFYLLVPKVEAAK